MNQKNFYILIIFHTYFDIEIQEPLKTRNKKKK